MIFEQLLEKKPMSPDFEIYTCEFRLQLDVNIVLNNSNPKTCNHRKYFKIYLISTAELTCNKKSNIRRINWLTGDIQLKLVCSIIALIHIL